MKRCPECGRTHEDSVETCDCGHSIIQVKKLKQHEGTDVSNLEKDEGFFSFRKMISIVLIQIIYAFGMVAITIYGIKYFADAYKAEKLIGLAIIVLGNLLWRILCEGWILLFRIHEVLCSIEKKLPK